MHHHGTTDQFTSMALPVHGWGGFVDWNSQGIEKMATSERAMGSSVI